jgi:hypothetical protein
MVRMETEERGVENIRQLSTSTTMFSKMLSSSLKTVSPHKRTGFFITAEDDSEGNYLGMTVVLKTGPIDL